MALRYFIKLAMLAIAGGAIALPFVFEFIRHLLETYPPSCWTWLIGGFISVVDVDPIDDLFNKGSATGVFIIYALYFSVLFVCYQIVGLALEEFHHQHYSSEPWQKTVGLILKYIMLVIPITLNPLISWMIARGLTYRYLETFFACNLSEIILLPDLAGGLLASCVFGITIDFFTDYLDEVKRITSA